MNAPLDQRTFRRDLLAWYRASARALLWRAKPSLYKTVVSEFMLQQTQVKTALPYFERWIRELPGFDALADAPETRVLKLWEGLGYYSRARNLHKLARAITAMPEPPRAPAAWIELPGVGPYTAAAITSISFGEPIACVDGNVVRILARLTADGTVFRDSSSAAKYFTPIANTLVNKASPGDHNQAMMELGATICTRQNPSCAICPVRSNCAATRTLSPEQFPRLAAKKTEEQRVCRIWFLNTKRDAVLLHRASPSARRLAGIFELPSPADIELGEKDLTTKNAKLVAGQKRSITRYRITEKFFALTPDAPLRRRIDARIKTSAGTLQWIALGDLAKITLSGPHRRIVQKHFA
ncbi:A/G-specific adenine glycosylase [Ereboglobus sp. PH5-5]|uniref:A/G-specific adenine glycosylase n=1 Tax=Ereboglobus sp. PH5-5 TaxID=2940529 RepID=UPI002406CC59|nr:A/G-specific adenine glycosylase [Ereboglobus sp. PH5-5]MDF9832210.1 A/G-specific adenine glycosylase [Ereboglobus sp. PH5-5]